jgi:hypothetical protein
MPRFSVALVLLVCALAGACSHKRRVDTYTLYRNGAVNDTLRIHVASFDAAEPGSYNHDTCERVRELFQLQPTVTSRFWCEAGPFKR